MAAERIIADTCAWIDFFNARPTPLARALEQALVKGTVHACGIVTCELVQGVRSKKEEALLLQGLDAVPSLEMTESLWIEAGRLSASLRRQGITLPLSDVLIATLAMANSCGVLTSDRHFEAVPGLRLVSTDR